MGGFCVELVCLCMLLHSTHPPFHARCRPPTLTNLTFEPDGHLYIKQPSFTITNYHDTVNNQVTVSL